MAKDYFTTASLSSSINLLAVEEGILGKLGIFKKKFLTETTATVEYKDGVIALVENSKRGTVGQPIPGAKRNGRAFPIGHLQFNDEVVADSIQNVRAFGTNNQPTKMADAITEKLSIAKNSLEYTREMQRFGALKGQILDAQGDVLYDLTSEFGISRLNVPWTISTSLGKSIISMKSVANKRKKGESVSKWACLVSPAMFKEIVYAPDVFEIYKRYQDAAMYRGGLSSNVFEHEGVMFIEYGEEFPNGEKLADDKGVWLPLGTQRSFAEYFAPADYIETVNTKALEYYAKQEKKAMDKGYNIEAQTNPLAMVLRPDLTIDITFS